MERIVDSEAQLLAQPVLGFAVAVAGIATSLIVKGCTVTAGLACSGLVPFVNTALQIKDYNEKVATAECTGVPLPGKLINEYRKRMVQNSVASVAPVGAMAVAAVLGAPAGVGAGAAAILTGVVVGFLIQKVKFVDNDYIKEEEARAYLRKCAALLAFDDPEKITALNLRQHHRYLSKQYHPDKHSRAPKNLQLSCEKNFFNVQNAYAYLKSHLIEIGKWDNTAEVEHERQMREYEQT